MRSVLGCPLFVSVVIVIGILGGSAAAQQPSSKPPDARVDEVAAWIGDHVIRLDDVERYWRDQDPVSFNRLQQQLYEARRRALDALIGQFLVAREADRRRVTVERLLGEELGARVSAVTESDIQDAYRRSPAATQGLPLEQAKPAIVAYLRRQKEIQGREQFVEALRRAGAVDIVVMLQPPRQVVPVAEDDPAIGSPQARVQLVVFSDFECPYCKRAAPVLRRLVSTYPDEVRLIWKDFPLPTHPLGALAAEAARCARDQGKFWEYHDALFAEDTLEVARLGALASGLGLDRRAFDECLDTRRYQGRVAESLQQGRRLGVEATPTVLVNGRMVRGLATFETYERLITDELAAARVPSRR